VHSAGSASCLPLSAGCLAACSSVTAGTASAGNAYSDIRSYSHLSAQADRYDNIAGDTSAVAANSAETTVASGCNATLARSAKGSILHYAAIIDIYAANRGVDSGKRTARRAATAGCNGTVAALAAVSAIARRIDADISANTNTATATYWDAYSAIDAAAIATASSGSASSG
jgi:hypothetical protein